jgi:hypothetical protein
MQRRRRPTRPDPLATLAIALTALLPACSARVGLAGHGSTLASYSMGTLKAEVGPEVPILTAAVAAEQTLRARGYTVTQTETTDDRATVTAKWSNAGYFDKAVIDSWITTTGTALAVRLEPFGDEPTSYAIMDDLLTRLGR